MTPVRPRIVRFGLAPALTACAAAARLALDPYLRGEAPYSSFFIAVTATAYLAGPGPAILAAVLGGAAAEWFFVVPRHELRPHTSAEWLGIAFYCAVCAAVIGMTALLSRARRRSEASAAEAALRQADLEREVEERKRTEAALRDSEEKLRLAKDAARMGAWNWDLRTGELSWTERCKALFAIPPDAAMTYDVFMAAIHPDDRQAVDRAVKDALARRSDYDVELRVPWPDGGLRWVASHGRALRDEAGEPVRMAGMAFDITDRKRAEEALRDADARKSEFLGVLSHELRNPLAPIRNSMYLLDRVPPDSLQAQHAKEVVRRQTEHLSRLVDDLLDVTRVSRGKIRLQRERLDVRKVVRRTCEDLRSTFDQSGIDLRLDLPADPVCVDADPTRLAQVVGNLLQNANKFTPARGIVTVSLHAQGARATIEVIDTGIGMEPGVVEHMFEPFMQEERGLARTRGGLGLGLALAKGLIELHGGRIEAHSAGAGRGSEFVITLPLAEPALQATSAPAVTARTVRMGRRVLIVEDNLDAAETLAEVLELEGHEVRMARDGTTGLSMAREVKPDVVFCDIGLPDLDGYEVARALRADESLRPIRLVAVTGYAQPEDKERAREAGFDAHLTKPSPIEEVISLIE